MITLFAIPKPMEGEFLRLQENAILSWVRLGFEVEILLFGGERGVEQFARRTGIEHHQEIARTEEGTPRVDDLFRQAESLATRPLVGYINADIILGRDFLEAVRALQAIRRPFLAVGRRWDLDFTGTVDYSDPDWEAGLRREVDARGTLHPSSGIDYFIYRRGLWGEIPPFAVGRTMWDNWLIWRVRKRGAMVVDATESVWAVHQNHGYNHHPQGSDGVWKGPEAERNERLAGGLRRFFTIDDATHRLADGEVTRFRDAFHRRRWWYTLPAIWAPAAWATALGNFLSRAANGIRKRVARMRGRIS
jgi:hypothetical protein